MKDKARGTAQDTATERQEMMEGKTDTDTKSAGQTDRQTDRQN